MNLVTIVAETAAEALAEVHRRLGPEAVVVNVRKTSAPGLSRIWKKPQIELQATVPSPTRTQRSKEALADLARSVDKLKKQLSAPSPPIARQRRAPDEPTESAPPRRSAAPIEVNRKSPAPPEEALDLSKMLENLGLLPLHAQWLADQAHGGESLRGRSRNLREDFGAVQDFLVQYWNRLSVRTPSIGQTIRVLVGPPGVGKTTCICKWLTQEVLLQGHTAWVWRLDTDRANTAEFLSIHGEILGVPVERIWEGQPGGDVPDVQFIDLPGVQADDRTGIAALKTQIEEFKRAQVLLVLNAAYDLNNLLAQVRAFSVLPLAGVVLTHTDEEGRWSKFWNLLLSSKLPILYLSGGQNIPGYFSPASPQSLFEVSAAQELD